MGWDLPERVKRLTLSSYRYLPHDLDHIELILATLPDGEITGVAAWEPARYQDLPDNKTGILLHGLYVAPRYQHQGFGSYLLDAALEAARSKNRDGLLVKAQADAIGFFQSQGFCHLPVDNTSRDYPHKWWKQA